MGKLAGEKPCSHQIGPEAGYTALRRVEHPVLDGLGMGIAEQQQYPGPASVDAGEQTFALKRQASLKIRQLIHGAEVWHVRSPLRGCYVSKEGSGSTILILGYDSRVDRVDAGVWLHGSKFRVIRLA